MAMTACLYGNKHFHCFQVIKKGKKYFFYNMLEYLEMKKLRLLFQTEELSVRTLEQLRAISTTLYLWDNTLCLDTAWAQPVDTLIRSAPTILEGGHIEPVSVWTRGWTAEVPVGCCLRCWRQIIFSAVSCRWRQPAFVKKANVHQRR